MFHCCTTLVLTFPVLKGLVNMFATKWNESSLRKNYLSGKKWGGWILKKGGGVAWVLGITLMMVGFPLVLQIEREQQLIELEQQQMNQGYAAPQYGMPQQPVATK